MQGDTQAVQAISAAWTFEQRAAFAEQQLNAMQNCMGLIRPQPAQ